MILSVLPVRFIASETVSYHSYQGLKPLNFPDFTARLKPCPDTNRFLTQIILETAPDNSSHY